MSWSRLMWPITPRKRGAGSSRPRSRISGRSLRARPLPFNAHSRPTCPVGPGQGTASEVVAMTTSHRWKSLSRQTNFGGAGSCLARCDWASAGGERQSRSRGDAGRACRPGGVFGRQIRMVVRQLCGIMPRPEHRTRRSASHRLRQRRAWQRRRPKFAGWDGDKQRGCARGYHRLL